MRRQTPIAHLLYNYLFPHPTTNDPVSFSAHLARNLVPEVRIEVATFYGDLNSAEARYPGLNYCHPPHRMRLGRFRRHKRLFEAFDELGLTYNEIQDFCCWEGTKWARERYEKDEGIKVHDTTGDEIGPFVDRKELRAAEEGRRQSITKKTDISVIVEEASNASSSSNQQIPEQQQEEDEEMDEADVDSGDEQEPEHARPSQQSVSDRGESLADVERRRNRNIFENIMAAHESGTPLTPEIEQYLKEQSENGTVRNLEDIRTMLQHRRSTSTTASTTPTAVAPRA